MSTLSYAVRKESQRSSARWAFLAAASAAAVGAGSAYNPSYAAALALAVVILIVALRRPSNLLLLLVASIFLEVITLGGVTISRLVAPVALLIVVIELLRGTGRLVVRPPLLFALAYSGWALASGMWTVSTSHTLNLLGSLAIALVYMLSFAVLVDSERQLKAVIYVLAACSLLIGIASLLTFAGHPIFAGDLQAGRTQGGVGDPNFFANVQLVAFPLVLVLAAAEKRFWLRWGLAFTALVTIASVLSTLSRGGLIALVLVLLIIPFVPARSLFASPKQKMAIVLILAAGLLVLFSRPGFRGEVVTRAQTIFTGGAETGSTSGSGRTELWRAARHSIDDHPLVGLGFGAFPAVSTDLLNSTPGVDLSKIAAHPKGIEVHSAYLGTAADLGLIGLALFISVLVATGLTLRRTAVLAREAGELFVGRVAAALVLSLVAWSISSIFIETETSRPLWIVVGLSLALAKLAERRAVRTDGAVPETHFRAGRPNP
jgi:O-antigen ligase